jgi:tRNA(Ile)-lysidine synthase
MVPTEQVERFRADLDSLIEPGTRFGVAVSGGPDSLALLLLAAEARPGEIAAATVDHGLREGSRDEAEAVADICESLEVPHAVLAVEWDLPPDSAIQEKAREVRYGALSAWMQECGLSTLLTAHHLDDQAETFLMRLARGAGIKGLAAMRRVTRAPAAGSALVRPLLGWRHAELEAVCAAAKVEPIADPSNDDDQFERVRIRRALAEAEWLDPTGIAASASHVAEADAALHWATSIEWKRAVTAAGGGFVYRPSDAPREIRRRIIRRAVLKLATEGGGTEPRGRELDQLLAALSSGRKATLRGVLCVGGRQWRFSRAPARKA